MCLCGFLPYVVCLDCAQPAWGRAALVACAAVVGTVAYSRMYLETPFLSDILGGFTAGLAYLSFAIWGIRSAPPLGEIVSWWPLARGVETLLVPATAGSAVDQVTAPAVASMATAASVVEAA